MSQSCAPEQEPSSINGTIVPPRTPAVQDDIQIETSQSLDTILIYSLKHKAATCVLVLLFNNSLFQSQHMHGLQVVHPLQVVWQIGFPQS